MKVLVIGSGAREHALCWMISQSPYLTKLWCAPGNPGIAKIAECVPMNLGNKREAVNFANTNQVDLVVIGPEGPLVDGLADDLAVFGIKCCGPTKEMARLEGSKSYTKEVCLFNKVPTAACHVWFDIDHALSFLETTSYPTVIKADGLAAGKGVFIPKDFEEAKIAIEWLKKHFETCRESERVVVIEEFLEGTEVSYFALCDGTTAISFGTAQDHKRLLDGDQGPNTGGMGAISPAPIMTPELDNQIMSTIIEPVVKHTGFRGILFAGLMITKDGPKVLEFNVRFGDPECQTILPRLLSSKKENDLLMLLYQAATGSLTNATPKLSDEKCITVIMAAPGYPYAPQSGSEIQIYSENPLIFHAGTRMEGDKLVAAGGRGMSIGELSNTIENARWHVYRRINSNIIWPEGIYRKDIGQ